MARLLIKAAGKQSREVELKPGVNRFGRDATNDFKIDEPSVSLMHCEIVVQNGNALLKDLGSTNGTLVNGYPVRESYLKPGQSVTIGAVELVYEPKVELFEIPALPKPAAPSELENINQPKAPKATLTPSSAVTAVCENHPQTRAVFVCRKCRRFFCAYCVKRKRVAKLWVKFCPRCGERCMAIAEQSEMAPEKTTILQNILSVLHIKKDE
jgi:hypothetical protein